MTSALAVRRRRVAVAALVRPRRPVTLRQATPDDAPAIHELIAQHLGEGHLLPRRLDELRAHAHRFVLAVDGREAIGCADLAPLSRTVAEVRSLVVTRSARSLGAGGRLVDALVARAAQAGFERLCAFTHAPAYFVQRGFSIVPHEWLPEKISTDCSACSLVRRCGQYAVMVPLDARPPEERGSATRVGAEAGGHYQRMSLHG